MVLAPLFDGALGREPRWQRARPGLWIYAVGVCLEELPRVAGQPGTAAVTAAGVAVDDEAALTLEQGIGRIARL